jgi:peroxiredoxin Q/BCP
VSPRPSDTLAPGDAAPDFTLPDAGGHDVTRSIHQAGRPLLLFFFRGTWCPQCQGHMGRLRDDAPEFDRRNVALLGVVAQKRTRLQAWLDRNPLPFPMLADEERTVSRAYGVYVPLNLESFRIARPATFLLDAAGVVRWLHVGVNQFDRPRPAEVLRQLDLVQRLDGATGR